MVAAVPCIKQFKSNIHVVTLDGIRIYAEHRSIDLTQKLNKHRYYVPNDLHKLACNQALSCFTFININSCYDSSYYKVTFCNLHLVRLKKKKNWPNILDLLQEVSKGYKMVLSIVVYSKYYDCNSWEVHYDFCNTLLSVLLL